MTTKVTQEDEDYDDVESVHSSQNNLNGNDEVLEKENLLSLIVNIL
jgi:hypothetical protein